MRCNCSRIRSSNRRVPIVQRPRTPAFHAGNEGSNPSGDANSAVRNWLSPALFRPSRGSRRDSARIPLDNSTAVAFASLGEESTSAPRCGIGCPQRSSGHHAALAAIRLESLSTIPPQSPSLRSAKNQHRLCGAELAVPSGLQASARLSAQPVRRSATREGGTRLESLPRFHRTRLRFARRSFNNSPDNGGGGCFPASLFRVQRRLATPARP